MKGNKNQNGASTKRRGLILVVFILALWGLFGNSYFGPQTTDLPKSNHVFHGSSSDLSLAASQVNYKKLYEDLLNSKSGNSEAVQQLSSELAAEKIRNQNLLETLQQLGQSQSSSLQSSFASLPSLPSFYKETTSGSNQGGEEDEEGDGSWGWMDSIKDSVNYLATSMSPGDDDDETDIEPLLNSVTPPHNEVETTQTSTLVATPEEKTSLPSSSSFPLLTSSIVTTPLAEPKPLATESIESQADSIAAQVTDALSKQITPIPPAPIAVTPLAVVAPPPPPPPAIPPPTSQTPVTSNTSWPNLGNLAYVTQDVIDELTYKLVGQPHTETASLSTCGNKEACRKAIARKSFLSNPPGGKKWRVCLMPKTERGGVRAFMLLEQGIRLHPNITWVEIGDIKTADWVIWMPGSTKQQPTKDMCPTHKLIVIDFGDGFQPVPIASDAKNYGFYFKRSWVTRKYNADGRSVGIPNYAKKKRYFPMSYSIAEEFLLESGSQTVADVLDVNRIRPVVCTLRPSGRGSRDVRKEVLGWVKEAANKWDLKGSAVGEVDHGGRREIQNKNYLQTMREARIVVTANPTGWEGDSRTWEALASGAMVMVDKLETPLPHPLLDKVHVVYYDSSDKEAFLTTLKYYLDHPDEAKIIGINGHAHAVKYHMTVNRADYLLNVVFYHKEQLWKKQAAEKQAAAAANANRRRLLTMTTPEENEEEKGGGGGGGRGRRRGRGKLLSRDQLTSFPFASYLPSYLDVFGLRDPQNKIF